jgi:hypothetical protein
MLTAACGYSIKTEHDTVLDRTTTRMSKNVIGGVSLFGATVAINGMKTVQDETTSYGLFVQTLAPDWIFPRSLTLRIDDEVVDFGEGTRLSADVDCGGGSCTHDERYYFDATEDELRLIAGAGAVVARIGGAEGYLEKEFSRENIANFADFVAKAIDGQQ